MNKESEYFQTHIGPFGEILHFSRMKTTKLYNPVMKKWINYECDISKCIKLDGILPNIRIFCNKLDSLIVKRILIKLGYTDSNPRSSGDNYLISDNGVLYSTSEHYYPEHADGFIQLNYLELRDKYNIHEMVGEVYKYKDQDYIIIEVIDESSMAILESLDPRERSKVLKLPLNKLVDDSYGIKSNYRNEY